MILKQGKKGRLTWSALLLTATCTQAGTMGPSTNTYNKFEVSAAGGVNWYNVPNTHVVISPFETDSNHVNLTSTDGAWKAGVGYSLFENLLQEQRYFNHLLLELNIYQTFATLRGSVWQFGLPEFNNYSFKVPVTSTRLMFDVKPNLFVWERVSPYAILGIGATWNTLSYNETATGSGIVPSSALSLSKNTTAKVAWDAGVGFSVALTERLNITAEYIYAFLGHGSPGNGSSNGVSLSAAPSFSLQTQNLLFGLSLKI
ncbi:outer membrane protein [Legionella sp.]|uniref:outer membrane protein n=1 Tax=Legionella sp. TaxID=459 RepID=UPI003CB56489